MNIKSRIETLNFSYKNKFINIDSQSINYYIYFLSDEKIKIGDWFIANQLPHRCLDIVPGDYPFKVINSITNEIGFQSKHWEGNKIIATNNPNLNLPMPSCNFIQEFIKAKNEDNPIIEVIINNDNNILDIISSKRLNVN
jgi:hypothetical protein